MKFLVITVLFCSTLVVLAKSIEVTDQRRKTAMSGPIVEGFQISAAIDNNLLRAGSTVRLKVQIRNTTKKSLTLAEAGPEKNYQVTVYGRGGRSIPLTAHGKALLNTQGDVFANMSLTITPGQQREDVLDVSSIYDMSVPGDYWIFVRRKVEQLQGKGISHAQSNIVHLQILTAK